MASLLSDYSGFQMTPEEGQEGIVVQAEKAVCTSQWLQCCHPPLACSVVAQAKASFSTLAVLMQIQSTWLLLPAGDPCLLPQGWILP